MYKLQKSFLEDYLEFGSLNPETPPLYHKWCGVLAISSMLGQRAWITRGHFQVFPNLYVMLMGDPGTGKGAACALLQRILTGAGYSTFAADRSSKEKFLEDFNNGFDFDAVLAEDSFAALGSTELFGTDSSASREVCILAEEFNDFIGKDPLDFVSLLTKLWSYTGVYRYRLKTGKQVAIPSPCVNLLGGNTQTNFSMVFPPELLGQGFLARMVFVAGRSTGKRISFPKSPDSNRYAALSTELMEIRNSCGGEIILTDEVIDALDGINQRWPGLEDIRFKHYGTRRFTQLLKLCIVMAANAKTTKLTLEHVKQANELLLEAEDLMPYALGEFGKARNSDVANTIMSILDSATAPIGTTGLWKHVSNDLDSIADLAKLLSNMLHADKVQQVNGGWLPKRRNKTRLHLADTTKKE